MLLTSINYLVSQTENKKKNSKTLQATLCKQQQQQQHKIIAQKVKNGIENNNKCIFLLDRYDDNHVT